MFKIKAAVAHFLISLHSIKDCFALYNYVLFIRKEPKILSDLTDLFFRNLHVEHDVVHEVGEAGLHRAAELGRLHQRVHELEDGEHLKCDTNRN